MKLFKPASIILLVTLVYAGALIKPPRAFAQEECTINNLQASECKTKSLLPTTNICGSGENAATDCITWFVNLIFLIAITLSFVYLLWGGIDYIMAGGDTSAAGNARTKLTNAIIGLIVVIVAWAISNLVLEMFGVDTEVPLNRQGASGTERERIPVPNPNNPIPD